MPSKSEKANEAWTLPMTGFDELGLTSEYQFLCDESGYRVLPGEHMQNTYIDLMYGRCRHIEVCKATPASLLDWSAWGIQNRGAAPRARDKVSPFAGQCPNKFMMFEADCLWLAFPFYAISKIGYRDSRLYCVSAKRHACLELCEGTAKGEYELLKEHLFTNPNPSYYRHYTTRKASDYLNILPTVRTKAASLRIGRNSSVNWDMRLIEKFMPQFGSVVKGISRARPAPVIDR